MSGKRLKTAKKALCLIFVLLLSINSFAAVVSDNDGSAFITKAEFDSLKNDFQSQIDAYNTSIDAKIDEAISQYLSGIKVSSLVSWPWEYDKYYERKLKTWVPNSVASVQPILHFDYFVSISINSPYINTNTVRMHIKYDTTNTTEGINAYYLNWDEDVSKYIITKNREKVKVELLGSSMQKGHTQNGTPANPTYYYFGRRALDAANVEKYRISGKSGTRNVMLPYGIRYGATNIDSSWNYTDDSIPSSGFTNYVNDPNYQYKLVASYKYDEFKINRIVKNDSDELAAFNNDSMHYYPDTSNFATSNQMKLGPLLTNVTTYFSRSAGAGTDYWQFTKMDGDRKATSTDACSRPYLYRLFKHSDYPSTKDDYTYDSGVKSNDCAHYIEWISKDGPEKTLLPMTQIALGANDKSKVQQCIVNVPSNVKSCRVFYYSDKDTYTEKDRINLVVGNNILKFTDSKYKLIVLQFEYNSTTSSSEDVITFSEPMYLKEL